MERHPGVLGHQRRRHEVHALHGGPFSGRARAGAPPDPVAEAGRMRLGAEKDGRVREHRGGTGLGESRAGQRLEEDLGVPPRHVGVGLPVRRHVAEVAEPVDHLLRRSAADPELESAARDEVGGTGVLDHVQRVLVAHVDDGCPDLDALGASPDRGEQRERRRELLCEMVDPEVGTVCPELFDRLSELDRLDEGVGARAHLRIRRRRPVPEGQEPDLLHRAILGPTASTFDANEHVRSPSSRLMSCIEPSSDLAAIALDRPPPVTSRRWPILAIFILSGAAGLMYEVVWSRQLVLVFGNTTQAISVILTGFFGGMAIGSWGGGRLADRVPRPLLLYGVLEAILVVVVLLTPLTFRLIGSVYQGAFTSLEASPQLLGLVRFGLALLALAPATILMGATLPTLTRYLSRDAAHLSSAFGRLYAANTVGAIIGAAAAGLVLIEVLGLSETLLVAAGCSALAGATAIVLDRRRRSSGPVGVAEAVSTTTAPGKATVPDEIPDADPRPRIALVVAFVSGLTSLAYQVLSTRLLASGSGNYAYVFTLILVLFLAGIAIGAVLFTVIRRWIRHPVALLARTNIVIGVLALAGVVLVLSKPFEYVVQQGRIDGIIGVLFSEALLVVLPATIVMGLSFPASSALVAGRSGKVATSAGQLLASNTLGAIVGTFVVPFFVIPAIGAPDAIGVIALVNVTLGLVLAYAAPIRSAIGRVTTYGVGAVTAIVLVVALATNGILVDPSVANIGKRNGELYASREDEIASVQAGSVNGFKQLWVTGASMTALTVDARLMVILPLIVRPESKHALIVCFGMGSGFRTSILAGLTTDAVELVPSVPSMFGYFFPDAAEIRANPNGHVLIADGRNHMELTEDRYDIIVTDPPPPVEAAGISVISSLEYYQAGHDRLTPGGIMMQWVSYGLTVDELQANVRTFAAVFPEVLVFRSPGNYGFFMLGSDQPMGVEDQNVRDVLARPGVLQDISGAYASPARTAGRWAALIPTLPWLKGAQVASFAGPGPFITDDRPLPEYFLLRRTFGAKSPLVSPRSLAQAGFPLP